MASLCVIEGDGIGPEVIPAAVEVLRAVVPDLQIVHASAGWGTFLECGVSVPAETLAAVRGCGAALFGAVSSPSRKVAGYRSAILTLRQELGLYSNIRPVCSLPSVSPRQDVSLVIVRENTEGLYSGRESMQDGAAIAERVITRQASSRIALRAAEVLRLDGRRRVTIVHKANVLPVTDGLFRDAARQALETTRHPCEDWEIDELLVDNAAYQLAAAPQNLDVIVTTNLFGDILSDEAAHWCGGMGLAPSLNWGEDLALAEPVHGSAPDIAGKGIANPIASILSAALLLRYYWKMPAEAKRIEKAVTLALEWDIPRKNGQPPAALRTEEIASAVLRQLEYAS
jgi:homoisocitrate dehydrogenase